MSLRNERSLKIVPRRPFLKFSAVVVCLSISAHFQLYGGLLVAGRSPKEPSARFNYKIKLILVNFSFMVF